MLMVDAHGHRVEVILLDRCDGHGPQQWLRVTTSRGYLLGAGYYRTIDGALQHVDTGSLVEVIAHPASNHSDPQLPR